MRVQRRIGWIFAVSATVLMMSGCQDSKAARDARLAGIEQMNQGNYEEAIVSFDLALDEADGIVNEFELDVLKYRAEAEYMTEDFTAAAHTYGILADVDDGKPEYFYYQAASEAMAGNLDGAVKAYESALGDTSGAGESDPDRGKEGSEEESAQETDRETDSLQTEEDQTEAAQAGSSQEETETSGDFLRRSRSQSGKPLSHLRPRQAALWPCQPSERHTRIRAGMRKPWIFMRARLTQASRPISITGWACA